MVFKNSNCIAFTDLEYEDDCDEDCAANHGKHYYEDFCDSCKLFYVVIMFRRDDPRIKKLELIV